MQEEDEQPIEEVLGIGSRIHSSRVKELLKDYDATFLRQKTLMKKVLELVERGDFKRAEEVRTIDIVALINERVELKFKIDNAQGRTGTEYIEEPEVEDVRDESTATLQETIQPIRRIAQEDEDSIEELAVIFGLDEEE